MYLGSAVNLHRRFVEYYSINHLEGKLLRGKSALYTVLLKYEHLNFKLDILVYCEKEQTIELEQKYIDEIKPSPARARECIQSL